MQLELRLSMPAPPPAIAPGSAETRIRGSAAATETCAWAEATVSRSPHQGCGDSCTTSVSGFGWFLSVDPAGRYKPTARPQAWNRYAYASTNPFVRIDPDGLRDIYVALWHSKLLSGSVGHAAAFELNGKSILSQFPNPRGRPHGKNDRLTYSQTVKEEGRIPDNVYRVFVPDDKRFDAAVNTLVSPQTKSWDLHPSSADSETNCSAAVTAALRAGGVPVSSLDFMNTPDGLIGWFAANAGTESDSAQSWSVTPVRNDILNTSGSVDDLLRRMHEFDWLFADAFGTQIEVTRQ